MNWIRFDSLGLFGIHNYRRIKLLKTIIPEKMCEINCETSLAKVYYGDWLPEFLSHFSFSIPGLVSCQVVWHQ